MKINIPVALRIIPFMILFCLACGSRNNDRDQTVSSVVNTRTASSKVQELVAFSQPETGTPVSIGDIITIELNLKEEIPEVDSICLLIDREPLITLINTPLQCQWNTTGWNPGKKNISAELFSSGTLIGRSTHTIELYSDIVPSTVRCQVLNVYPHDHQAYTQGLIIDQGYLFESTGVRGKSSLRKLELETGELLASLNLPPDLFGEGITVFDDKIIQLTWTSGYGFIYDKNSFKFLRKVHYGTQGWGITYDGDQLIMSDGSHYLIFMDPENFSEIKRLGVYDHQGRVDKLNELEYINGKIYANIYTTDLIAIIDPANGKVLNYLDCSELLEEKDRTRETDVLNGIAYDSSNSRLYITGKNWPKLFEIRIYDQ